MDPALGIIKRIGEYSDGDVGCRGGKWIDRCKNDGRTCEINYVSREEIDIVFI
jgi:hypothetical protein